MANNDIETAVNREKKSNPQSINASVSDTSGVLPPPDGGLHAWAQVVSGHFVVALTWGYAASFGVFQNHYETTLPQTPSDISWIGGVQVFCIYFISTLSGRATDAGMARLVVGVGAVLLLLGTFMTSLATKYWQIFLAQGICTGIGQGLMWLPSITLISTYFVRLRVFAVTAAATGTMYATEELGLSEEAGVNLIIVTNALRIPIRPAFGYLADRHIGPLNCLIPWVALCGILMFCWAAVHTVAELYVFAVFYGLASAAAMALFAGTVPSLTKDLDKIGTRVGMALSTMSVGPLTGPSVAGALIARTGGGYLASQMWAGATLIVAALALVGARFIISGPHLQAKL
ncbi:unnamed protein product [Aspergillus oryzae]|nr:unnamed protein product [Aspergillus oryzae]GMF83344.1 unnamed protein product [Aspergillus oryzae]